MEHQTIMAFTNEVNRASSIASVNSIELKYNHVIHAYKYYMLGVSYQIHGDYSAGFQQLLKAGADGVIDYTKYLETPFSDAVGSSLYCLLNDYPDVSLSRENRYFAFAYSYVFLSSAIEQSGTKAFESLKHRANLMRDCGDKENITTAFVGHYLGIGSLPEVLILSDYYFSYIGYQSSGMHDDASWCLRQATYIHEWLEDMSIAGKDADDYSLAQLAEVGKDRHGIISPKTKVDFQSNKFPIDFKEFAE